MLDRIQNFLKGHPKSISTSLGIGLITSLISKNGIATIIVTVLIFFVAREYIFEEKNE